MCNCLQEIAEQYSEKYGKNGVGAAVQASAELNFYVRPYIIDSGEYGTGKLRLSKHGHTYGIELKFCPNCGKELTEPMRSINVGFRQTW